MMEKRSFLKILGFAGAGLLSPYRVVGQGLVGPARAGVWKKNWMWVRKGSDLQNADWARMFRRARSSGIRAVLPELYNSKEALFRSDRHPVRADWLGDLLPIARDEGLELHAWMWMMPCNQERIWKTHPEWYAVNRKGEPAWQKPAYVEHYRFLCPSRPEVHEFLRGNVAEIAAIDGIAGVHLDYIRYPDVILAKTFQKKYGIVQDAEYPEYDYCYCDVCRESFRARTGRDPLSLGDPASDAAWAQFRYDRITFIVDHVLLPEIRKHGKAVTAAVFPNWKSVRQQWMLWNIDAVMPMLYHGFYDKSIDWIGEQTSWGVNALSGRMELYPGLFVDHMDPQTLPLAVDAAKRGGASGIGLFEGRSMNDRMWDALREGMKG